MTTKVSHNSKSMPMDAQQATAYFQEIENTTPEGQFKDFILSLSESKLIDKPTFVTGVKQFIQIANTNPFDQTTENSRLACYGNSFLGLHYRTELVTLWNQYSSNPIKTADVCKRVASPWQMTIDKGECSLSYQGKDPAHALDRLVQGPTVIDCGLFTQLSIWFGIRYMLGNQRFNQCFGSSSFLIKQVVFVLESSVLIPHEENPLFKFFATAEQAKDPCLTLRYISNSALYSLKHPAGNYSGENCLLIGNEYAVFDPQLNKCSGLSELDILAILRQAFNLQRDQFDKDRLLFYAQNVDVIHPRLRYSFGKMIQLSEQLADTVLNEADMTYIDQYPVRGATFDLHLFMLWLGQLENQMASKSETFSYARSTELTLFSAKSNDTSTTINDTTLVCS